MRESNIDKFLKYGNLKATPGQTKEFLFEEAREDFWERFSDLIRDLNDHGWKIRSIQELVSRKEAPGFFDGFMVGTRRGLTIIQRLKVVAMMKEE